MEFYEKLQMLRKENGMSQEDFAAKMGVSRQAVSKWENGQGYPETEKLLLISSLYSVSLDDLLKNDALPGSAGEDGEAGYYASRETVGAYLQYKHNGALRIALGVSLCVLSVIAPIIRQDWLGAVIMFSIVCVGVLILVSSLFRPKHFEQLEKQPLVFDPGFEREFQGRYNNIRKKNGLLIMVGVALSILGLVAAAASKEVSTMLGWPLIAEEGPLLLLMFVFWAIAASFFIIAGSALYSAGIIAKNAEHIKEVRRDKKYDWVHGSMMLLATAIFLLCGFLWDLWKVAWAVYPVLAVISAAIVTVLSRNEE